MKNTNYFRQWLLKGLAVIMMAVTTGLISQPLNAQNQIDHSTILKQTLSNPTDFNCDLPPGWYEPQPTPTSLIIAVSGDAQVLVNAQQMNPGDVIGAFYTFKYGYRCGGFGCLTETGSFGFVTFGDDPITPEKDGFENGEEIHFKVFSWICGKTFDVDSIAFSSGTNIWHPLEISEIIYMSCTSSFECQITANEQLTGDKISFKAGFKAGQWNNFSLPDGKISVDQLLAYFGAKLIVVREAGTNKMIWPEMNIYTITEFVPDKEYQVMVSED